MNISLEEYTDLLKKYEELRQEKIKILNKYYVEKDDLNQEIEILNNIIKEAIEYIQDRYDGEVLTHTFDKCNVGELLNILKGVDKE